MKNIDSTYTLMLILNIFPSVKYLWKKFYFDPKSLLCLKPYCSFISRLCRCRGHIIITICHLFKRSVL